MFCRLPKLAIPALLLSAVLATGLSLHAQNARFLGHVTDSTGALVAHSHIEIRNLDTDVAQSVETDEGGAYSLPYLIAGRYRISVKVEGFDQYVKETSLKIGEAANFDIQLTIGASNTTVEVQGSSNATEINTENSEVSSTITAKEVQSLQLNGRNVTQFVALAPGVSNQTGQDEARVGMAGSVSYSVNGGRTEYNSFQVDGSEVLNVGINRDHTALIVTPSIDAIQEVKVLTSNYSAEYPSAGSGTTLITTRSGTDAYHGTVYEFFRNEAFNAKGYFDIGKRAPLYRRHDFGGTIGGPLSIPKIYDAKGKTHFFFSEEARIEKDPYAYRQAVPSLAERNGDFSDVCPAVGNGFNASFSRTQYPDCPGFASSDNSSLSGGFANNQLNYGGGHLNPNAVALLNTGTIPLPTAASGCNSTIGSCYNAEVSLPTYWREELFRIDHNFTQNWIASFRYIHDEWDETAPVPVYASVQNTFPTIQSRFYGPGRSLVARVTGAFSPTFLNEFVVSYTNSHLTLANIPNTAVSLARPAQLDSSCLNSISLDGTINTYADTCMSSIFTNNFSGIDGVPKPPGIVIAGNNAAYGGFGFATDPGYNPWVHNNPIYTYADNLTKTLGRHTLQFGAQFVAYQRNQTNGPIGGATGDTQGLLTFTNQRTQGGTGNGFADFLYTNLEDGSGAISSFQQDSGTATYRQRYKIAEPYLQDNWKVNPRLTLNAGLRLSLFGTFYEKNNNAYNWEASAFSQSVAAGVNAQGAYGNLLDLTKPGPNGGAPIYIDPVNPSANLDPRITNGIVRCGVAGRPRGCMSGHLFNPSPRVGFAWDPRGNGKTSIRAGYGVFFEHGSADENNTGSLEGAAPNVVSMTVVNPQGWSSIGLDQQSGFFTKDHLAFPLNVTAIQTKAVWPYVQQFSGSIERQVSSDVMVSIAYVGSKGTHLTAQREINQLRPATQNPFGAHEPLLIRGSNLTYPPGFALSGQGDCLTTGVANFNNLAFHLRNGTLIDATSPLYPNLVSSCYIANSNVPRPNSLRTFAPGVGEIYSLDNVATSSYHAFQLSARRSRAPFTLNLAYTYSHGIDDASDRSDATFVNSFNLRQSRSSSNYDQRHLLHVSYIYDLPLIPLLAHALHAVNADPDPEVVTPPEQTFDTTKFAAKHWVKSVLGGWQLSGITQFETGIPFTVINNGSPAGVSVLDNAGVANGLGSGSYPDLSGISVHSARPSGGNNSKSFGPLLLNPGAFVAPRGLTFGNAGRNFLNNPNRWNFDNALLKQIPIREGLSAEFRMEAFNLFNHTQFRIYDPTLGNQAQNEVSCYGGPAAYYSAVGGDGVNCLTGSSFLHPVDAHRPRTIQFALKLFF
jgi:hypothetical protein